MSAEKKMRYSSNEDGFKSVRFEIRMDKNTFDKLEKLADKKSMTKSEVIRELIEKTK